MPYECIVGLEIKNEELYAQYRQAMFPILQSFGGGFRYDFKIAETLKSDSPNKINRVFAIYFRDQKAKDQFYADPEYGKVKAQYFTPSVAARTMIAEYSRD